MAACIGAGTGTELQSFLEGWNLSEGIGMDPTWMACQCFII